MNTTAAHPLSTRSVRAARRRCFGVAVALPMAVLPVLAPASVQAAPHAAADAGAMTHAAYTRFCDNNSDLCTVTERVPTKNGLHTRILKCTLNSGPHQCPPAGVVIGGPYYRHI